MLFFFNCVDNSKSNKEIGFEIPKLYNSRLSNLNSIEKHSFDCNHLLGSNGTFIGKFKFSDSVDINPLYLEHNLSSSEDNYIENEAIDESFIFSGLEFIVDYESTVYYNWDGNFPESNQVFGYYPIYIVNSTKTNKILFGKDQSVFVIQEAINNEPYDSWAPIEGKAFDFCGNGSWRLIIRPNEFGLILMKKYKGDYKTKIRARIKNGDNILVSDSYWGEINKSQFKIKDSSSMQKRIERSDASGVFSIFYGADAGID